VVEYAGAISASAYRAIDARSLLVDHCTVRNNNATGIYDLGTALSPGRITNNVVNNNSISSCYPWYTSGGIYATYSAINSNTVNGNLVTGDYCRSGGIFADHSTVSSNTVSGNSISVNYTTVDGGGIGAVYSTVSSNTVTGNSVTGGQAGQRGGGIYAYGSTVSDNIVSGNTVSINWPNGNSGGGGISADESTVSDNIVSGNTVSGISVKPGGGILAAGGVIMNNIVMNNTVGSTSDSFGGGIYAAGGTILSNTISTNSATYGGGIYIINSGTVSGNTVTANKISAVGEGSGIYIASSPTNILGNTIVGNTTVSPTAITGGLTIYGYSSSTTQAHYNNLYGNSNYDVVVEYPYDISGTNNYFGTAAYVDINRQIYDWYDDSSRGKFLYVPYLQDPDPNAPVVPPQNLRADFTGGTAALSWDAIRSTTTGYGYKVYYDNDTSGPPYNGTDAAQGNSPIEVGNVTSYTLSGLGNSTYYIAVTADDTHGRESRYSNEVNSLRRVYLPVVLKN
jgi:hypothetical protein